MKKTIPFDNADINDATIPQDPMSLLIMRKAYREVFEDENEENENEEKEYAEEE